MLVGAWPGLVLLATAVHVEGSTTCPTAEQVLDRLRELLPTQTGSTDDGGVRAELSNDGDDLIVVVVGAGGDVIGTRRFPRGYACEGLASAVAVSVAVWVSDVHPAYPSTELAPAPRPAVDVHAVPPAPVPPPNDNHGTWGAGLALGLGGSVDVPAGAADAVADGWWRPWPTRTALRLDLEAQSRREVTLQEGKGAWRRWTLGMGIERRLAADASGAGWLRGFATARLALLDLQGEGFMVNHHSRVLDPGGGAGLRVIAKHESWASWVELALALWPVGHDAVAIPGTDDVRRLPIFEAFVRVGAGWGTGR